MYFWAKINENMSSLASLYLKKETLETLLKGINQKGLKGIELTISISDTENEYGNNVSSYVSQTKEERDVKKEKFWTGNGKVYWTNGTIVSPSKREQPSAEVVPNNTPTPSDSDLLPF